MRTSVGASGGASAWLGALTWVVWSAVWGVSVRAPVWVPAPSSGSCSAVARRCPRGGPSRSLIAAIRSFLRIPEMCGMPICPANLRRSGITIADSPLRRRSAAALSEDDSAAGPGGGSAEDREEAAIPAWSAGGRSDDAAAEISLPNRLMSLTQVLPNRPEAQLRPACSPSDGMRTAPNPVRQARRSPKLSVTSRPARDMSSCGQGVGASLPATTNLESGRLIVRVRGPRTRHRRPCTRCLNYRKSIAPAPSGQQLALGWGGSPSLEGVSAVANDDRGAVAGDVKSVLSEANGIHHSR